jgi:hypothetical protein
LELFRGEAIFCDNLHSGPPHDLTKKGQPEEEKGKPFKEIRGTAYLFGGKLPLKTITIRH